MVKDPHRPNWGRKSGPIRFCVVLQLLIEYCNYKAKNEVPRKDKGTLFGSDQSIMSKFDVPNDSFINARLLIPWAVED